MRYNKGIFSLGEISMFNEFKLNENEAYYTQIKNYIEKMITEGILKSGQKLPSTRELSSILNVSRNTIISAYESLCDEEFIIMKKGKGAYVLTSPTKENGIKARNIEWDSIFNEYCKLSCSLDIVKNEAAWKKNMISFKSISPDPEIFDIEDIKRSFLNIVSIEGNKLFNYGYARGYEPLIQYILGYMKEKGVNIQGKDVLITNGFTEGFDIIASSLIRPKDKVLCENPTHNTAIKILKLHGANIKGIDMESDGVSIEALEKELKPGDVKLTYLIPSYHNPTGVVMSAEKRLKAAELINKYGVPLVEDGFNEELRYYGDHMPPLAALWGNGNSVLYVSSFSKVLFPGIRVGFILADSHVIDALCSVKRSRNIHTSAIDQAILYEYLKEGYFESYIKKARKLYRERYCHAVQCAEKYIPYESMFGEGGLHIFLTLHNTDARELLKECMKKGVIFTPGDIFYTDGKGKNTLRLGFSRTSFEEIEKGFRIIGDTIKLLERRSINQEKINECTD